ncbi:MAG TPA: efflux RND transporter periplasmic adaptor subunit [Burkholderiaceae bacterium]
MSDADHPLPRPSRRLGVTGAIVLAAAIAVAAIGIVSRKHDEARLAEDSASQHTTVNVVVPMRGPSEQLVVLPGTVRPDIDAPIYARVPGYLKTWYTDIGAHVRKGQLLAEIETPELDQQILRERSNVLTAQSNLDLAELTAKRWQNLVASNAVSRQEADEKAADAKAKSDILQAAQANLKDLLTQQSFNRIVAPFDGVVTERNTDIGKLINPGSSNGQALFRIADNRKLRIYVEVPQNYAADLKVGMIAQLRFPEYPSRSFPATLVSTSQALHETSRTLTAELQMQNKDGEILPGTYTEAHFSLPGKAGLYLLPASTLLFRKEGLEVATVGSDNRVILKHIALGRDLGASVEVVSGIEDGDKVIESPSDSILQGSIVHVKAPAGRDSP